MADVANVPAVVVEGVANCLSDEIGHFFDELATRNPRFPGVLANPRRNDLRSMCLVHRSWTPLVQRVMRRRVRIHFQTSLKRFLKGPHCGPWVVELWYIHDREYAPRREKGKKGRKVQGNTTSHWELLAELLSRLPNLRFLSVELRDDPWPGDSDLDSDEDESDSDEDVELTAAVQNAQNSEAEPEVEALKISLAAIYEKAAAKEKINCRGIMATIRAIGRLSSLEGLSILSDLFHTNTTEYNTYRHRRYIPYLLPLCDELSNLTKLRFLHIRGWSTFYNRRIALGLEVTDAKAIEEKRKADTEEKEFYSALSRKCPPPSLKNLVVEIPHYRCDYFGWLQGRKNEYSLDNLCVVFDESCSTIHVIKWATLMGDNAPRLLNLRVEHSDEGLEEGGIGEFEWELRLLSAQKFFGQQTRLETLHVAPVLAIGELPITVTDFRIVLDTIPPETSMFSNNSFRRNTWKQRDYALREIVEGGIPELCDFVELSITDKENEYGDLICDGNIARSLLPRTFKYCDEDLNCVELNVVEEQGFARRAADFLLYGRVQWYVYPPCKWNTMLTLL